MMNKGTITVIKAKSFIVTLTLENGKKMSPPSRKFDESFLKELPQNKEVFYELNKGTLILVSLDNIKNKIIFPVQSVKQSSEKKQVHEYKSQQMKSSTHTNDPARAPYNFVPLNEEVVASNGISVSSKYEGLCGYIDIQIEAKTPLFIRGANKLFVTNNNLPFIPGSSLRGMIRNIVNITSYGKLNQFSNRTLFHRTNMLSEQGDVNAGFLRQENGKYTIYHATAIQSTSDHNLSKKPHNYQFNSSSKTCKFSVGKFQHRCRVWVFTIKDGTIDVPENIIRDYESDATRNDDTIDILKSLKKGEIVDSKNNSIGNVKIPVQLGIPIFYREENKKVISFGHAKRHRIPYSLSIGDHIIQNEVSKPDFSESIFGTLEHPSKVFFEDCQLIGNPKFDLDHPMKPKVLSSPKPTTHQHYLKQPSLNTSPSHQNTWSTNDVPIRGYKNYWHRETTSDKSNSNTWIETEIESSSNPESINPISINSSFKGRIRFENLSTEELGALLFAIDLPPNCFHKLGLGKPLGLGSVSLSITQLSKINRIERYKTLFVTDGWEQGINDSSTNKDLFKNKFVEFVSQQIQNISFDESKGFMCLWESDRLSKLREMLTFKHDTEESMVQWENRTRYMKSGAGHSGINEYERRPILPSPDIVVKENTYKKP